MTAKVEKTVLVTIPVSTAHNQWMQFEHFPSEARSQEGNLRAIGRSRDT